MYLRSIALIACTLLLYGCSNNPPKRSMSLQAMDDAIAMNMVFVISQVPKLHPDRNVIYAPKPDTDFDYAMQRRLLDAGFAIKRSGEKGLNRTYKYNTVFSSLGFYRVSVDIDEFRFKRSYLVKSGVADPVSPMVIEGSDSNNATYTINDYVFPHRVSKTISRVDVSVPNVAPEKPYISPEGEYFTSEWFGNEVNSLISDDQANVNILNSSVIER